MNNYEEPENPVVKFYEMRKCGFYKRGEYKPLLGDIGEILENLNKWVKSKRNKSLGTCPFKPIPNEDLRYALRTAIEHDAGIGDCVISTFNNTAFYWRASNLLKSERFCK
ncbi:MAG: hypothetical protein ACRBF0_14965 [Calditrichia bacterium]